MTDPTPEPRTLAARLAESSRHASRAVAVARLAVRGLYRSQIPRMAAALAYRTIFSIIPVLVISLLVFGALVSDRQVQFGVERLLDFTGLKQIAVEGEDFSLMGPPAPQSAPAPDPVPPPVSIQDPAERAMEGARLDQLITDLVRRVNESLSRVPSASIAIVSAIVLIYAALSMLVELERSFNTICGARQGRPWLKRLILYWTVLTLGTVLLAATFAVGDIFKTFAQSFVGSGRAATALLGYSVTVVISTLLLLVAYVAVPNRRVPFRSALAGAVLAAILWELGKWGFRSYLDFSTGYARFYGSLAILPLFLLWIYVTWIIVLLGMEVAYALHDTDAWRARALHDDSEGPRVVDPASLLLVAAAVARRFAEGKLTTASDAGAGSGLPDSLAGAMLERLRRADILRAADDTSDDDRAAFVLARPPEAIPASDLLRLADAEPAPSAITPDRALLARLADARAASVAGLTLADIARGRD